MKFLTIFLLLATSLNSFAGNEGGGGGAVVCRDQNRKIISAELLDLFEGPILHGLKIVKETTPYIQQVTQTLRKLDQYPFLQSLLWQIAEDVQGKMKFLPNGITLIKPRDTGENTPEIMREGCELEGLGYYTGKRELLIAKETFNALSETDKAAFILHETVYFIYREYRGWEVIDTKPRRIKTDSFKSREVTATFFDQESSHFDLKDLFDSEMTDEDEVQEEELLLPKHLSGSGHFEFRFVQNKREPSDLPNSVTFTCTGYSKHDIREQKVVERFFKNQPINISFSTSEGQYCNGLTVSFKYPLLIESLEISKANSTFYVRNDLFNGEGDNGLHFNLATKRSN